MFENAGLHFDSLEDMENQLLDGRKFSEAEYVICFNHYGTFPGGEHNYTRWSGGRRTANKPITLEEAKQKFQERFLKGYSQFSLFDPSNLAKLDEANRPDKIMAQAGSYVVDLSTVFFWVSD